MEVFIQRNFVADFFRQKLNFTGTNSDIAFLCHPLGDLGVTYFYVFLRKGAPTSQTDDRRQTDGSAIAYSEREREFTSAKNSLLATGDGKFRFTFTL